jgi:hypothetical protein
MFTILLNKGQSQRLHEKLEDYREKNDEILDYIVNDRFSQEVYDRLRMDREVLASAIIGGLEALLIMAKEEPDVD